MRFEMSSLDALNEYKNERVRDDAQQNKNQYQVSEVTPGTNSSDMLARDVEKGRLQTTFRQSGEHGKRLEPHRYDGLCLSSFKYCSVL